MSKRAKDAALKAYPAKYAKAEFPDGQTIEFDAGEEEREIFIKGYKQAEKDLALTWEDIKEIHRLLNVIWITEPIDEGTIYTKVLNCFKKSKEK